MPATRPIASSSIAGPASFNMRRLFLPAILAMPALVTPRQLRTSSSSSCGARSKVTTPLSVMLPPSSRTRKLRQLQQRLHGRIGDQRGNAKVQDAERLQLGKLGDALIVDQRVLQRQRVEILLLDDSRDQLVGNPGAFDHQRFEGWDDENLIHLVVVGPAAVGGHVDRDDVALGVRLHSSAQFLAELFGRGDLLGRGLCCRGLAGDGRRRPSDQYERPEQGRASHTFFSSSQKAPHIVQTWGSSYPLRRGYG